MRKTLLWVQGIANFINVLTCIVMGIEVHTHIDPDKIIAEAYIMGICLTVNLVCALCKLYLDRQK